MIFVTLNTPFNSGSKSHTDFYMTTKNEILDYDIKNFS